MSDKVIHLAHRLRSSKAWSPADALRDLLERIESGEIKTSQLVVHYWQDTEDDRRSIRFSAAGLTFEDHISMLTLALHKSIEDWRS